MRSSFGLRIWANAQRDWPNARAFDEFRSHFVTVGRIDQMRCAFGQSRSAFDQLGKRAARLAKRARDLPNVAQLVNCRAFDQFVKCAERLPRCADWSNAPYITTEVSAINPDYIVKTRNPQIVRYLFIEFCYKLGMIYKLCGWFDFVYIWQL